MRAWPPGRGQRLDAARHLARFRRRAARSCAAGEPLRRPHRAGARGAARRSRWPCSHQSPTPTCSTRSRRPGSPFLRPLGAPFNSTFRPQEALTAQVMAATVRGDRRARPARGDRDRRPDRQRPGERADAGAGGAARRAGVDPNSGAPGYRGVQTAVETRTRSSTARAWTPPCSPGCLPRPSAASARRA